MRNVSWLTTTTAIALSLGGCSFFGGGTPVVENPGGSPSPSPVAVAPASPTPDKPSFEQPTVKERTPAKRSMLGDLISSTDPAQRLKSIASQRPDPFAVVIPAPTVTVNPDYQPPNAPPPTPSFAPPQATPPRISRRPSTPIRLAPIPTLVPRVTPIAPPPPQPVLAQAVQVTGVVQVGNITYAIVNAPNEPNSRYVQAGQRLSNNQVLVRRIDTVGTEPRVVLEQVGVEVVKLVGEAPVAPATGPAAMLPSTRPANS